MYGYTRHKRKRKTPTKKAPIGDRSPEQKTRRQRMEENIQVGGFSEENKMVTRQAVSLATKVDQNKPGAAILDAAKDPGVDEIIAPVSQLDISDNPQFFTPTNSPHRQVRQALNSSLIVSNDSLDSIDVVSPDNSDVRDDREVENPDDAMTPLVLSREVLDVNKKSGISRDALRKK